MAERFPENLSGGERQRIVIIRALANYPAMLLADEPTSSSDDENSAMLIDLLGQIRNNQKVAILLTPTGLYEKLPKNRPLANGGANATNSLAQANTVKSSKGLLKFSLLACRKRSHGITRKFLDAFNKRIQAIKSSLFQRQVGN